MRRTVFFLVVLFLCAGVVYVLFGEQLFRVWERRDFPRQKRAVADLQTLALVLDRLAEERNLRYPQHPSVIGTERIPKFSGSPAKTWPQHGEQRIDAVASQLAGYFSSQNEVPVRDP